MGLQPDPRRIVKAEIVPWEAAVSYGIAWVLDDGRQGADLIGTRQDTKRVLQTIEAARQEARESASEGVVPFPKDTAAS